MMLSTTKLYSLIRVCMTLMFTEGHRVTGWLERRHEGILMFVMADYIWMMTVKKS